MKQELKILVRLPNWLGDMVMASGFLNALREAYPNGEIDVIVKKGLESMLPLFPSINKQFVFDKSEWKGLLGVYRFGKMIERSNKYDLFFCLPDSFSSAVMGWSSGAKKRVGFKKELRSFLLTHSFHRPKNTHRVLEYVSLLQQYGKKEVSTVDVSLTPICEKRQNRLVVNFNSEAESRRMPVEKGAALLSAILTAFPSVEIILIGGPGEKKHVDDILQKVSSSPLLNNKAGQTTSVYELAGVINTATVMLSTDSGPAHLANALGVPVVVLFGAGNEKNTAPFRKEIATVLRLGQLPCEPCVSNICKFGLPKCLIQLDEMQIIDAIKKYFIS